MENQTPWEIQKIIDVANELQKHGSTGGSTSEQIAAAFVLNNMWYLPASYDDIVEAWEWLGSWQGHVKLIKQNYRHLIQGGG